MVKDERVPTWSPAHQVLLAAHVRVGCVQYPAALNKDDTVLQLFGGFDPGYEMAPFTSFYSISNNVEDIVRCFFLTQKHLIIALTGRIYFLV